MRHNVIVIGAGASGLMAAIASANKGNRVLILEHMNKPAKKILMTGNGKCNYSNINQNIECYRTKDRQFVENILKQFSQEAVTNFFESISVITKDKNGYLYPNSGQASVIVDALVKKAVNCGVKIKYNVHCNKIVKKDNKIEVRFIENETNNKYIADSVIVSTGGKTYSKTGSDGSGYSILSDIGHKIITPLPALTCLKCAGGDFKIWKGVRCDGRIKLLCDGEIIAEDKGELQLTDYGISGIPVFQVSRFASIGLNDKKNIAAIIDFMPDFSYKAINNIIRNAEEYLDIYQVLSGMFNCKLAEFILHKINISQVDKACELSNKKVTKIVDAIKSLELDIIGTGDFMQAQVCTGGISLKEVSYDMQSKIMQNVFITGELLDVDGICGGYNLQWAWSTGYIAGLNS